MGCGPACLSIVCGIFGKELSVRQASAVCPASAEGVSLLSISKAAHRLGLETCSAKVVVDDLCHCPLPAILHWDQKHFVVLYKVKNGHCFFIADPGKGVRKISLEELKQHWAYSDEKGKDTGIAMFLKPAEDFDSIMQEQTKEKKTDLRTHSFRYLADYFKRHKRGITEIIVGLIIGSILQLALPFLTQSIVDKGIRNQDIGFIWLILLGQLVLTISKTVIDFMRRWILLKVSMQINISLIRDFFTKLLRLPMYFFDTKLTGDILQRMNDHDRVNTFLTTQMPGISFSLLTIFVFSIVLLIYDYMVFAVFLIGSAIYGGWMALFLHRRKILDYEQFDKLAINNNKTYELVTCMQEIKLQNCENRRLAEWEKAQTDLLEVQMKSLKLQQKQEAGCILIGELKNIIITVTCATAVVNGSMTLGMMIAVQYIIGQLESPIEKFMNFFYSSQDVKISLERINDIHQEADEDNETDPNLTSNKAPSEICLRNVRFKYDPSAQRDTLNNINIRIPKGKITAIVGASGSGKTTLVKLMLGYYPVNQGSICIGNTDLAQLNKKEWRKNCGVCMQDGIIFSESIARNIAVSDGDADQVRLFEASKIACLYDYIMSLPLRFDTKIGRDGIGLSQGQKQRILIARAVYKNPDYIFLDEATNSLDANNERQIVKGLERFYKGKTVVVVAHRLSTVKQADQIVVIDEGRVVETGNHKDLVQKNGYYFRLVKNQLELGV